jgi:integrase
MPYCEEASRADKCIDYEAFTEVALQFYNKVVELRARSSLLTFKVWSSYLALTLIILINGLRVREALRVAKRFYETGDRKITIEAVKRGNKRIVIIPDFITREDLEHLYKMLIKTGEENTRLRVSDFLRRAFKVNPHSLRYSFIRYHTLTGKTPEEIARGLGLREKRSVKRYYLRGLPFIE